MTRRPQSARSGFTLIEILMVIGLIALLAGVLIVAVGGVVGSAKEAATKATIRKVDSLLTKRMEAFNRAIIDQDKVSSGSGKTPTYVQAAQLESFYRQAPSVAKVLARKRVFRQYFPQRFSEVPAGSLTYDTSKHVSETESAEMLYYFLTTLPGYGIDAPDGDNFTNNEIADTDSDGLKEIVDGWGQPLRYYRWPTRLVRPGTTSSLVTSYQTIDTKSTSDPAHEWEYGIPVQPTYGSGATLAVLFTGYPDLASATRGSGTSIEEEHTDPLTKDPDDGLGAVHSYFIDISRRSQASQLASDFERDYHTPDTYHMPLILSVGPDRRNGLYEPNNVNSRGYLAQPDLSNLVDLLDNVTNRNVRAGGK